MTDVLIKEVAGQKAGDMVAYNIYEMSKGDEKKYKELSAELEKFNSMQKLGLSPRAQEHLKNMKKEMEQLIGLPIGSFKAERGFYDDNSFRDLEELRKTKNLAGFKLEGTKLATRQKL